MINWTNLFLQETLSKDRLDILEKFEEIKKLWFYLAWGTALALFFGHRKSIDFDFFINSDIDTNNLFEKLMIIFNWESLKKTVQYEDTLYIEVNWIKISFFSYKYKNIWDFIDSPYFKLASIDDIACMKLWAIQKRATNKDYVDIYYILKERKLEDLIDIFYKKYDRVVSENMILKSLIYFDDIKEEQLILNQKNLTFDKIKKFLVKIVKEIKI